MDIASAQREMRQAFLGGAVGQSVSALLWLGGGLFALTHGPRVAMLFVALAGMFIFPVTRMLLKLMGERGDAPGNPLMGLGWQVAIPAALLLPLVFAATAYRETWFFPALLVAIGAHYLPFAFLYGMRHFLALGAAMIVVGLLAGVYMPSRAIAVAWAVAAMLLGFGLAGYAQYARESGSRARSAT